MNYQNTAFRFLDKLSPGVFFLILFLYQLIFTFQGLCFADEGFHATFYQQIYNDPESVQYNFMFWFTGVIGGAWYKLFSGLGLWGMRLAGALVTTGAIIVAYQFLKKYVNTTYLKLSLLLLTLFNSNDPKEIFYNNISPIFYVAAAYFLFTGLTQKRLLKIFIGGAFISLNTFTRVTNLAELCFILGIIYYGILYKNSLGLVIKQSLVFIGGFLVTSALLLLLMKALGHWDLFLNSFQQVVKLGTSKHVAEEAIKSQDVSNYYGLISQLKMFWGSYSISFRYVLLTSVVIMATASFLAYARTKISAKWPYVLLKALLFAAMVALVLTGSKLNNTPNMIVLYYFTGFTALMTAFIMLTDPNKDIRVLALLGCMVTLTYPVGSSSGIMTAGIYAFWLSLPITLCQFLSIPKISLTGSWPPAPGQPDNKVFLGIRQDQFDEVKKWGILICLIGCLYSAYYYPVHNASDRLSMRYCVNNKNVKWVFTNKERVDAIDELLTASAPYVKKDDYVFAYDASPMFHFLTETKPYLGNSYPWLYQVEVLEEKLALAQEKHKRLPVVIQQKVATNGWRGNKWPVNSREEYASWNERRNTIMNEFLKKYNYKEVWNNHAFSILVPEKF